MLIIKILTMRGIIHILLAWIIKAIIFLPMFTINFIVSLFKREALEYTHNMALMLDIYGNHMCKYVFNFVFLKNDHIMKYGVGLKTISHVTAMNYYNDKLTKFGRFFAKILIFFKDKAFDHIDDNNDN